MRATRILHAFKPRRPGALRVLPIFGATERNLSGSRLAWDLPKPTYSRELGSTRNGSIPTGKLVIANKLSRLCCLAHHISYSLHELLLRNGFLTSGIPGFCLGVWSAADSKVRTMSWMDCSNQGLISSSIESGDKGRHSLL